jgi:uncharacterized membrane protein
MTATAMISSGSNGAVRRSPPAEQPSSSSPPGSRNEIEDVDEFCRRALAGVVARHLIVGVTAIIGLVMAYVNRVGAPEWVKTHYRFQIRTFWIGLLYGFLSLLTVFIVVGLFFGVFTFIWWIVRSVKGLKLLAQGAAHEKPATWLW